MDKRLDKLECDVQVLFNMCKAERRHRDRQDSKIEALEKNLVDAAALEAATQAALADGPAGGLGGFNVEDIEDGGNSKEYMRGYRAAAECYNKQHDEIAKLKKRLIQKDLQIICLTEVNEKMDFKKAAWIATKENIELKAVINNRDDTIKELDRNNIKLVSERDALLQSVETLKFECGGDK